MDVKIPFYALDLRNISRLVKTKTKTRAMPNGQYWVFNLRTAGIAEKIYVTGKDRHDTAS